VFGLFASQEKKMRQNAVNWLELADKVWNYRRDVLKASELQALTSKRASLREMLKDKADVGKLKLEIEALEGILQKTGDSIYPKTSLTENIEFFLVAAIVILGIRTYFVQPFKIPTNSMWPTYYGMTAENFPSGTEAPGTLARILRLAAFGADRREAIAPKSGALSAVFIGKGRMGYTIKSGRTWRMTSALFREYTFYIDGEPTTLRVPEDFSDIDKLMIESYFGSHEAFDQYWDKMITDHKLVRHDITMEENSNSSIPAVLMSLPKDAVAGQPILRFDLMTGDQLFVDRMSYHFFKPEVGQGFVFKTGNIAAIGQDQYYIKRLVGVPGDVLEVKSPVLYRNNKPITGAKAFASNANRVAPYTGYTAGETLYGARYLFTGQTLSIPEGSFFAMGDNSSNSSDGRVWGYVPAQDVVGRPLFIYYPFTRRWGPAR
jgi:signal peptidase I